jgi:TRAP-type transport system periplasmic protein
MQLTRREMALGAVAGLAAPAVVIPGRAARAAASEFKIGMSMPKDHMAVRILDKYAAIMAQESNGRIHLQTYPSSQLGGDVDMVMQVRSGALEFQMAGGSMISNSVPIAGIFSVGFAFKNYGQVWKAVDGELGAAVRQVLDQSGLYAQPVSMDNGFRQLTTTSRKVMNVGDVARLKLRLPIGPVWTSLWASLGAAPTSIDLSELYTALQTGIVEGAEGGVQQIETFKFYEVQKNLALTNHMWDGWWVIGNKAMWAKLPDDIRHIMSTNFEKAAREQRAATAADAQKTQDLLHSQGMAVTEPDLDSFRDKLKSTSYYGDWRKKYGDKVWDALEQTVGKLS